MKKSEEIAILRNAAAALGQNSYCGPLLELLIPQIEQDMMSDIYPEFDLRKAQETVDKMKSKALHDCSVMIDDAKRRARQIESEAVDYTVKVKARAIAACAEAMRDLQR